MAYLESKVECEEAVLHIKQCQECFEKVKIYVLAENARKLGAMTSEAKVKSSRINGAKGGRPKKQKVEL